MKFNHIGMPAQIPQVGEVYLEQYDLHCTDHRSNPYGVQGMRCGSKCSLPQIVQEHAPVALEVDDLAAALKGKEIIIEPNAPGPGVMAAFLLVAGAPVELMADRLRE